MLISNYEKFLYLTKIWEKLYAMLTLVITDKMKDLLSAFMICLAKNTQLPRRSTITVINISKPGPPVISVSVISLGMQQAYNFFIIQWKLNILKILPVSC